MKRRIIAAVSVLVLGLAAATAVAVPLTFFDNYDGRSTLGSDYTRVCVDNSGQGPPPHIASCSTQTDWALNQWSPLAACGTASGNCYLSPHQAHFADYNRSAALVNATDGSPTSHLEVSVDITGEVNPDGNPPPACKDWSGNWCANGMNAGLVLNSLSGANLNDFVMCKIEVTPFSNPNGLLQITDWQNGSPTVPPRVTDTADFGTSNPMKVNGTTYHLLFHRTTDGGTFGTYHCTVSGPAPFTSVTITWVPTDSSLTYNTGTYAGERAKVAEDPFDQEDSGATRFDNFQYKVH